jgi:protein O-mannosyl-transferase
VTDSQQHRRAALLALMLALLTMGVFWPAVQNNFVNYDDPDYVTQNGIVQRGVTWQGIQWAFTTFHASNWHPLTWLSHMIDCALFGLRPAGHHFTSLALHAINSGLLLWLLYRLTSRLWPSVVVAALFAWHPLHVESFAWVAERKDVLSSLFWLLTTLAYVRYAEKPGPQRYVVTLLLFALGLMSKPMIVTLPCTLLLLDVWPLRRLAAGAGEAETAGNPSTRRSLTRLVYEKVPFFGLVVIASMVTYFGQRKWGAVVSVQSLSLPDRVAKAAISYVRYLGNIVWPHDLAVPYPPVTWPGLEIALAVVLLALITAWTFLRRRTHPSMLVGWLWFVGVLVPVIGLVQVGMQSMADRYTYISSIGLFIAIVWPGSEVFASRRSKQFVATITALLLIACVVAARIQLGFWRNSETLFSHAVDVTQNNMIAHNNLGNALAARGKVDEAIHHFAAAVRIEPYYADAYYNMGALLLRQNATNEAAAQFLRSLAVNTNYWPSHFALAQMALAAGNANDAIAHYAMVLQIHPNHAQAHNDVGSLLLARGSHGEALAHLLRALSISPDYADAHSNLGLLLSSEGRKAEAADQFAAALNIDPKHLKARVNLANVLIDLGRMDEAIAHYKQALNAEPNSADAQGGLGLALAMSGKVAESLPFLRSAVGLSPGDASAHNNLGNALAALGRLDDAVVQFRAALALQPNDSEFHYNLGHALAQAGRLDEGATELTASLKLRATDPEVHLELGRVLVKLGKRSEAAGHFREALRLKPGLTEAQRELDAVSAPIQLLK